MDARFKPMLCGRAIEEVPVSLRRTGEWTAEAKLDGWRCTVVRDEEGSILVYGGRNGSVYTGKLPYLEDALLQVLPLSTVVDGELISTVEHGHLASIMNASAVHRPSKALPKLQFVMFDVLFFQGVDLRSDRLAARREYLDVIESAPPLVRKMTPLDPTPESLEMVMELGFEGLVLKLTNSKYTNDRSNFWIKVKPSKSLDCKIVNLPHDGKGEFAGLVGAVEFELPDGQVGRASGMTRAVREEMTNAPERYLGRIAEIEYQYMTKDGRLRHPRFIRLRDDLEPEPMLKAREALGMLPGAPGTRTVLPTKEVKTRMRNYKAMGDAKLVSALADLERGSGDAYDRCMAKGGDPKAELEEARRVAESRGLVRSGA